MSVWYLVGSKNSNCSTFKPNNKNVGRKISVAKRGMWKWVGKFELLKPLKSAIFWMFCSRKYSAFVERYISKVLNGFEMELVESWAADKEKKNRKKERNQKRKNMSYQEDGKLTYQIHLRRFFQMNTPTKNKKKMNPLILTQSLLSA